MTGSVKITAAMTAHREGVLAGLSLRSFLETVEEAEASGLLVEKLIALDSSDGPTQDMFSEAERYGLEVVHTDYRDQGLARNALVSRARGDYVAFLDADDLWSKNWLTEALALCETEPGRIIAHPEFHWFFQSISTLIIGTDQTWPFFDPDYFRFMNYWDAMCLAPRSAHVDHPFCRREVDSGFAYEDWNWSCTTMEAGYVHRVASGTIHFKRRREGSQTLIASSSKALVRPTGLFEFDWYRRPSDHGNTHMAGDAD